MNSLDFDYLLIFSGPDRAIDAEICVDDNQLHEASKHSDASTITQDDMSNAGDGSKEEKMFEDCDNCQFRSFSDSCISIKTIHAQHAMT